ncbi:MAG: metallophosphoesterase family protein [Desulfatibacillum sp.]|nr:metallophosphoesterase family protein [Desulfatibacillum sp.]
MKEGESLIGIMADSHGQPEPIRRALEKLLSLGCQHIYHLGDICDSMIPQTADECVDLLIEAGVRGVKGNNDHAVVANQWGMNTGLVRDDTLQYLKDLPKSLEWHGADFAHSMPFTKEMGLSAMVGPMSEVQIFKYFSQKSRGLFFRGHSHDPALASLVRGSLTIQSLEPGRLLLLEERLPCVITCGALTRGYITLWDPGACTIQCLSIG